MRSAPVVLMQDNELFHAKLRLCFPLVDLICWTGEWLFFYLFHVHIFVSFSHHCYNPVGETLNFWTLITGLSEWNFVIQSTCITQSENYCQFRTGVETRTVEFGLPITARDYHRLWGKNGTEKHPIFSHTTIGQSVVSFHRLYRSTPSVRIHPDMWRE